LPKFSADLTINSILCMPRELSSTGMSDKVCNKVNSLKLEKIWLPLKRIMNKSESRLPKEKEKNKVDSFESIYFIL
jgi:hypothetical protein